VDYHSHPNVSFHDLLEVADPSLYYHRKIMGGRRADEPWMTFGRAYHAATLEGERGFNRDFVVVPEEFLTDSGRVSTAKPAREWKAAQGDRTVLSPKEAATCWAIARAVRAHPVASRLLASGSAEIEFFWEDEQHRIPLKAKADWVNVPMVLDLKGCRSLAEFATDALTYHYIDQLAWYGDAFGCTEHWLIAVEKDSPHRVGVFGVDAPSIARGRARNRDRLARLAHCYDNDDWRSPFESVQALTDGIRPQAVVASL
jgi:hypothetical protein